MSPEPQDTARPAVCAVVLAAGLGTRLRPLTDVIPKALCPVANVPLVDLALGRVAALAEDRAVNVHHHTEAMRDHLGDRVHLSVEADAPLGTAGALGRLRGWIDGRGVVVHNADAWHAGELGHLLEGWTGETIRLLVELDPGRPDFHGLWRFAGVSVMPWQHVKRLTAEPSGLYEVCWRALIDTDALELVPTRAAYVDCGTPLDYLGANLVAAGPAGCIHPAAHVPGTVHASVVGADAVVAGDVTRSLVLPGATVGPDERLVGAIRLPDGRTMQAVAPGAGSGTRGARRDAEGPGRAEPADGVPE